MDRSYACACCGQTYGGLFDIAFDHPDPWPHGALRDTGQAVLTVGADSLGTDLCEVEGQGYVRGSLPLALDGTDQVFSFGVWVSLHRDNFRTYAASFVPQKQRSDTGALGWLCRTLADRLAPKRPASPLPDCFGWLSNYLPGVDVLEFLPCDVVFQGDHTRPTIWVHEEAHPLAAMQRQGISFDTLLDIYAKSGTDLRPHLGAA